MRNVRLPSKPTFSDRLSVIATQRAFRNHFNVAWRDPVPDRKLIVTWVTTFRQTGSTTRRRTGVPHIILEHWGSESFNFAISRHFACKQASVLGLSDRSVRWIFQDAFISILKRWWLCINSPNVKDGLHTWCFTTLRQRFFCPSIYGLHTWCFTTFRIETRLEGQQPRKNCQYTCWYAGEDHGKHQKSAYSVYGRWGMPPTWCDFQNSVKQNFKCVLSLWNKYKTYIIYFYCLLKKRSYVATPVFTIYR